MRGLRHFPALAIILRLVSCNSNTPPLPDNGNDSGTDGVDNVIPFASLTGGADSEPLPVPAPWTLAAKPIEAAPTNPGGQNTLLNEVLFMPATGNSQFVEILAAVGGTVPSGLTLRTETGDMYVVPDGAPALEAGALLLIVFDGQSTIIGNTVHADRSTFLNSENGSIDLLDAGDAELDRVAWGSSQTDAVAYGLTGVPIALEAGMTLGRLPRDTQVGPHSWAVYLPAQTTPGTPNYNLSVDIMFPANGEVINSGNITLSWYPVPDATSYHVQLAQSTTLDALLLDQTVTEPLTTVTLGEGTYYWRVQVTFPDGSKSDWSLVQVFTLDDSVDLSDATTTAKSIRTRKGTVPTKKLEVPKISQRKDTYLLLLESMRTDAGHGWDEPHPTLDTTDWADKMNCALASVQMVNHFYGGDITQDELGFKLHQNDRLGPERDLNYAGGNKAGDVLLWALGREGKIVRTDPANQGQFWNEVTAEIDNGRPVIMSEMIKGGGHATVVIGYDLRNGKRYLVVNNPWNPGQAEAMRGLRQYDLIAINGYYLLGAAGDPPAAWVGRKKDLRIENDADNDQIKDFDEEVRFGTNKDDEDTDSDCIKDKDEIKTSVLDPNHGWAPYWNNAGSDGKARRRMIVLNGDVPISGRPELDADSDSGGLVDCMEDFNGDGKIDADESDPNEPADDHRHVTGTIDDVMRYDYDFSSRPNYDSIFETSQERHQVVIDLETDPDTGRLKGTADVFYTNRAYIVYRNPYLCGEEKLTVTQLNMDHPDRQWTVNLTGNFYCRIKDGKRVISISAYGTPDHSNIPDSITYHDPCYSDTTPGNNAGVWGGFYADEIKADGLERRLDYPLPEGPTGGAYYREILLKIEK